MLSSLLSIQAGREINLNPHAPHGRHYAFLEAFLDALGIDLKGKKPQCAVVRSNALYYTQTRPRQYTQTGPRLTDILILFKAGDKDYAIVVESRSHGAGDQKDRVRDYLEHIREEYRDRRKLLFYLKEGDTPILVKFIRSRLDLSRTEGNRLAA